VFLKASLEIKVMVVHVIGEGIKIVWTWSEIIVMIPWGCIGLTFIIGLLAFTAWGISYFFNI